MFHCYVSLLEGEQLETSWKFQHLPFSAQQVANLLIFHDLSAIIPSPPPKKKKKICPFEGDKKTFAKQIVSYFFSICVFVCCMCFCFLLFVSRDGQHNCPGWTWIRLVGDKATDQTTTVPCSMLLGVAIFSFCCEKIRLKTCCFHPYLISYTSETLT